MLYRTDPTEDAPVRFLPIAEVKYRIGLSRTEIYRRMKAGTFPMAVRLSEARVAWVESDIIAWQREILANSSSTGSTAAEDTGSTAGRKTISPKLAGQKIISPRLLQSESAVPIFRTHRPELIPPKRIRKSTMKTTTRENQKTRTTRAPVGDYAADCQEGRLCGEIALADALAKQAPCVIYYRRQKLVESGVSEGILVGFDHFISMAAMRGAYLQ
jgi:prophage regulatory protein